jgi:peptidoglycan/xylan/chitin deacetylase (PgdA/CDA1 family)
MVVNKVDLAARVLVRSGGVGVLRRVETWSGLLVLNYHRIGNAATAPFFREAFSATASQFDKQLAFLSKNADVIRGDDIPSVIAGQRGRHILLTFDDGYVDNFDCAYPLLRQHGLTATFFICTGLLDHRRLSWWDEISWMVGTSQKHSLVLRPWFETPIPLGHDREPAVRDVIASYRSLDGDETAGFLDAVGEAAGTGRSPQSLARDLWMSWDQVREMRAGGMTIGAHTVNHPILSRLTAAQQLAEIAGSRDRIAAELDETPQLFAYPVGKRHTFNADTRAALKTSDFAYAFSFYGGLQPFTPFDRFDIRRTNVNWQTTYPLFQAMSTLPMVFARW